MSSFKIVRRKDRLRNKFVRLCGGLPYDDFNIFTEDLLKTLGAFERFTIVASEKLSINMGKKDNSKRDDRGMIQ